MRQLIEAARNVAGVSGNVLAALTLVGLAVACDATGAGLSDTRSPLDEWTNGGTNPGLVTAVVDGPVLTLSSSGFAGGQTTLTVTATDLDGNTVSQPLPVEQAPDPVDGFLSHEARSLIR